MPRINKLMLQNFKKFDSLHLQFHPGKNVLIGDNEAGKSSILMALDLTLNASRSRVESLGLESLLSQRAVNNFFSEGEKTFARLPQLVVDVFLDEGIDPYLNGNQNMLGIISDGLRMSIAPIEEYGADINRVLAEEGHNFPYEYYAVRFSTFSGAPFASFKRFLRHLMLDGTRIDSDYAAREYTRSVYNFNVPVTERFKLENRYRQQKLAFRDEQLAELNGTLSPYKFEVRTGLKSNLETDLDITEDGISIQNRGKGKQCFIKTEFALNKHKEHGDLDVMLLEEPENHLSHNNMKKLVGQLATTEQTQLFIATHSSHICSRLDLRSALLLGHQKVSTLAALDPDTAEFFMKAPDNNVLEFVLSNRVILVEGDAEFILLEACYTTHTGGKTPEADGVHIISIGGTSFKRYLELARLLGVRVAAIRDNDKNYQHNCVDNYHDSLYEGASVFADKNDDRWTFEVSFYEDNKKICDELFASGRKTLTVQDYMLGNKAEAAFELLKKKGGELIVPTYIQEAIVWVRQ